MIEAIGATEHAVLETRCRSCVAWAQIPSCLVALVYGI